MMVSKAAMRVQEVHIGASNSGASRMVSRASRSSLLRASTLREPDFGLPSRTSMAATAYRLAERVGVHNDASEIHTRGLVGVARSRDLV